MIDLREVMSFKGLRSHYRKMELKNGKVECSCGLTFKNLREYWEHKWEKLDADKHVEGGGEWKQQKSF